MNPFYRNGFLGWIMNSTSGLVMSLIYLLYCMECVLQRAPCLMVFMDLSMMGICCPFEHILKIAGLMCPLKVFKLNSLYPRNMSMLKPLALYMLVTVFNYLMILFVLFEIKFSAVRKVILDDFVWRKGIPNIYKKSKYIFMCLWCSDISVGSGTLGNLLDGFLQSFMPP